MYMDLLVRGPVTAITCLVAAATFASGAFFIALRNTAIDCNVGSATEAACTVDVLETVVSALVAAGTIAGATAVGLVSPTPRDLSDSRVFRVDGKDINWLDGMNSHKFGANRTIDNPAVVEYQHNATSAVHKYLSYQNDDGNFVVRHPTGIQMPTGKGIIARRSSCEAYIDAVIYGDPLRSSELAWTPIYSQYSYLATDIFDYFVNNNKDAGCFALQGTGGGATYTAYVDLGASCSHSIPGGGSNCGTANYNQQISDIVG